MRIAITGGTGFVGSHLAQRLDAEGHDLVLLSRRPEATDRPLPDRARLVSAAVTDDEGVREAFEDCDAVAHLAGINVERGSQTYENVHVRGTRTVVETAADAGVESIVLTSYLRARPDCGSPYHESKWTAEEIVRASSLTSTVVKPGLVFGRGDQLLTQIARALATVPVFPRVGLRPRHVRPLAVEDLVDVLVAGLYSDELANETVAVTGPEELTIGTLVSRISEVLGRRSVVVPTPVSLQHAIAWLQERTMGQPIVSTAGVRMLAEGATDPLPRGSCEPLPASLEPTRACTHDRISAALPSVERFGLADFRR